MPPVFRTNPPGKYIVLYDGHCPFCVARAKNITTLGRRGAIVATDFQGSGALDRFPGITHDACMHAMHLVTPDGRVYRGFEAGVRAVATRRVLGWPAFLYYLPGFRQLCDRLYTLVAANRYRLRRGNTPVSCEAGTCSVHFPNVEKR
jgi:predicted DCC family thiol-disulfide oxidoreductase YuxK